MIAKFRNLWNSCLVIKANAVAPNRKKPSEKRTKPGRIQTVLTTLGREIAQEVIPAGAALPPEPVLESRFGVGRGVIREAIKILAGKGLVSVRPRHGTHVLPRRDWSLLDRDVLGWLVGTDEPDRDLLLAIQEVRMIIEPAATATEQITGHSSRTATMAARLPRFLICAKRQPATPIRNFRLTQRRVDV